MKKTLYLTLAVLVLTAGMALRGAVAAKADSAERHIFAADAIPWGPAARLRAARRATGRP